MRNHRRAGLKSPLFALLAAVCFAISLVNTPRASAAIVDRTTVNLDCSGSTVKFVVTSRNPFDRPADFTAELLGNTGKSLGPPKGAVAVPAGGQVTLVFHDAPEAFPVGSVESSWRTAGYNAGARTNANFQGRSCPAYNQDHFPAGKIVLSVVDGRNYGMLAYAIDPETRGPVRMRVWIPGLLSRESNWNYRWADMPRSTGIDRTESLLFLTQLPPGTHSVCFDALDPQGGGWTRLDCRTHTVK